MAILTAALEADGARPQMRESIRERQVSALCVSSLDEEENEEEVVVTSFTSKREAIDSAVSDGPPLDPVSNRESELIVLIITL